MKHFFVVFFLIAVMGSTAGFSQVDPSIEQGIHPFGSYDVSKVDTVNIQNGGVNVKIPLFSYPERGKFGASVYLRMSSKQWTVNVTCDQFTGSCGGAWELNRSSIANVERNIYPNLFGIGIVIDDGTPALGIVEKLKELQTGHFVYTSSDVAVEPDGSTHPIFGGTNGSTLGSTVDASGIIISSSGVVTSRNGVSSSSSGTPDVLQIEDPNGNIEQSAVSGTVGQDSIGRNGLYAAFLNAQTITDASGCGGSLPIVDVKLVTFPGPYGSSRQVKLCSVSMAGQTNFNASFNDQGNPGNDTQITESTFSDLVLQSVVLYNGVSWSGSPAWTFDYNNDATGSGVENYLDLTKITFPTGGTISYAWDNGTVIEGCGYTNVSRFIYQRVANANDGSPEEISTYTSSYPGPATVANYNGAVIQSDEKSYVTHSFGPPIPNTTACNQYEVGTVYHDLSNGSDKVLKTVQTDYSGMQDPFDNENPTELDVNVLPIRVTTTLANGMVSKVETDYDSGLTFTYWDPDWPKPGGGTGGLLQVGNFSRGLVLQKREYGYGQGAPGALVRCTAYDYEALDNSAYMNANILDLPSSVKVYSGACGTGTLVSQTTNGYDETALQSSGITTQHDGSIANPGIRGNQTSVHKWLNTTGGTINTYASYYDTGMPYQSTDGNGNTTTYSYSPTYAGGLLTQTQMPATGTVQHSVSAAYDFNTGLMTSYTDQNSKTTKFIYDGLSRMTSASFPDQGLTTLTYPLGVYTSVTENITNGKTTMTEFDGLGRKSHVIVNDSPQNDTVDYTYDWMERLASVSNPYRTTNDPTYGITSYTYDALDRKTLQTQPDNSTLQWVYNGNVTDSYDEGGRHWQRTTDAFGNLIQVREPNVSNSPTIETDHTYDALNRLTRVDQWGGPYGSSGDRVRGFTYDSLNRLLSAVNPESGVTSYSYDNNSNVQTKTDARGITTTYSYDALNRLLSKSYSDGTLSACMQYDASQYAGTEANLIGHLTNEWTQAGSCPLNPPSSGFLTLRSILSYDPMGRLTNEQQCTPTKCSPQSGPQLAYDYDLAGNQISLTNTANTGTSAPVTLTTCFDATTAHITTVTGTNGFVCGTQPTFPDTLYTLGSYGPVGPLNWNLGSNLSITQSYTKRLQVQSITANGQLPQ